MDPLLRDRLSEYFSDAAYKFLISLLRSKETSEDFYSMKLKTQKATENDLNEIAKEQAEIFLDELDKHMNNEHILKFEDVPDDIRKKIAKEAMDKSLNNWVNRNKGRATSE